MQKYVLGRNPYPENSDKNLEVIEWENIGGRFDCLKKLEPTPYISDKRKQLRDLTKNGFKELAWTPNIRHVFYNEDKDLLVNVVEGDIFIIDEPTDEEINAILSHYPKQEVAHGEKYDERFNQ